MYSFKSRDDGRIVAQCISEIMNVLVMILFRGPALITFMIL